VPMLLRHMRHQILLLSLLSGLLFGLRSAAALDVGDKAPDFTLPSTTGELISLHQFLGKKHLLIEFYVRAFGPT
jgi:AhpC/TSA family